MPSPTAPEMISAFGLKPHPEGGHYRETFLDPQQAEGRPASAAILFLLASDERSHWHRVDAGFELAPGDWSPRGQTRR